MAYHGYLPTIKRRCHELQRSPSILEIGIDRGVTFVSLAAFLARTQQQFMMIGVDIMVQEQVQIMVQNLDLTPQQNCFLLEGNSLDALPKMIEQHMKFDVLLIDGDHNYYTVTKELEYLDAIANPGALVIIDDYLGRWADKDLYYSERPGYENVKIASPRVDTDKHGVKTAVDEFVAKDPTWKLSQPINGEPVVLTKF